MNKTSVFRVILPLLFLGIALGALFLGIRFFEEKSYPRTYEPAVLQYAKQYDVDPALVFAVIRTESSFQHDVISHAGAMGLMQITPDTFSWLQFKRPEEIPEEFESLESEKLLHPETNIKYGVMLLSILLEEYGNTETALCAYNAGRGNVQSWLQNPEYSKDGKTLFYIPFTETRNYVKKVMDANKSYHSLYFQ